METLAIVLAVIGYWVLFAYVFVYAFGQFASNVVG